MAGIDFRPRRTFSRRTVYQTPGATNFSFCPLTRVFVPLCVHALNFRLRDFFIFVQSAYPTFPLSSFPLVASPFSSAFLLRTRVHRCLPVSSNASSFLPLLCILIPSRRARWRNRWRIIIGASSFIVRKRRRKRTQEKGLRFNCLRWIPLERRKLRWHSFRDSVLTSNMIWLLLKKFQQGWRKGIQGENEESTLDRV